MIRIRPAAERGHFDHGWLKTWHSFSFGDYRDPAHVHFRTLRVINEDRVAAGHGFDTHPHRDMEILTLVLSGQLQHRDSLGNSGVLRAGELQRMTAGTGILHSESNPSPDEPLHLYQIWIFPGEKGLEPGYEQRSFPEAERIGRWQCVASPEGADGSLRIHQAVRVLQAALVDGQSLDYPLDPARHAWLQVVEGKLGCAGQSLRAGDGVAISQQEFPVLQGVHGARVLLFDLA